MSFFLSFRKKDVSRGFVMTLVMVNFDKFFAVVVVNSWSGSTQVLNVNFLDQ